PSVRTGWSRPDAARTLGQLGSGLIDPEDKDCGEGDCRQEGVSTSVVPGVYAPPIFEASEQVLDLVALAVEDRIVAVLDTMAGMGRDARGDAALDDRLAQGRATVGPVG